MHSGRREDMSPQSPTTWLRDRRYEVYGYRYLGSGRNEHSLRYGRSLSPSRVDRSQQMMIDYHRKRSIERTEHVEHLVGGRGESVRSRSPQLGYSYKQAILDGNVRHRDRERQRLEDSEATEFCNVKKINPMLKHVYSYDRSAYPTAQEKEMHTGYLAGQELSRLHNPSTPSTAANMDADRYDGERISYLDLLPSTLDKPSAVHFYEREEKPTVYSRDALYPAGPVASQFNDNVHTSKGISRGDVSALYRDVQNLPLEEFRRSSGKNIETAGFDDYSQRSILNLTRDLDIDQRDQAYYRMDAHSHTKNEHVDDFCPEVGLTENDHLGYTSSGIYRKMSSHGCLNLEHTDMPSHVGAKYDHTDNPQHAQADYNYRDQLRSTMNPSAHTINPSEGYQHLRKSIRVDHPHLEQSIMLNFPDRDRAHLERGRDLLDSGSAHVQYRRVPQDFEDVSLDNEPSHLQLDYGLARYAELGKKKEKLKCLSTMEYDAELHTVSSQQQRINPEKFQIYDTSGGLFSRRHDIEGETSRKRYRGAVLSKWSSRTHEFNGRSDEWTNKDIDGLHSYKMVGFDHTQLTKADRAYDERGHRRDYPAFDEWLSSQSSLNHKKCRLREPIKSGSRHKKSHPGPSSSSWPSSSKLNKKNNYKPHNVWRRISDDHHVDVKVDAVNPSEEVSKSQKFEVPENSEEFKQLVHKAFFSYTKKLNENSSVYKLYKEQGKAGTLFCIACGRSLSKDFMDTQRLATHAFMSRKHGLRAEHLGLLRAICVLMGWNSVVDPDAPTWAPQILPEDEAWLQKEDLMLWPPLVIIHNSANLKNNPNEQKVEISEELGAFLTEKGFARGKIKVCHGKRGNHSVMIVKFVGTFSGLQDAERLHQYFAEKKSGRPDFQKLKGKEGSLLPGTGGEAGKEGGDKNKMLQELLYGYMGIAEDLEKLDSDTKKWCLIKSRKEIRALADGPIRPDQK